MAKAPKHRGQTDSVSTDLVAYLIVSAPDLESLATLGPALAELVASEMIRILDLVAVTRDADGAVDALELDAADSTGALRHLADDVGHLLSVRDIELASLALRPGTAGLVLVTEDRWAKQLSAAARRAGGEITAGERIPASRVESALADGTDDDWRRA